MRDDSALQRDGVFSIGRVTAVHGRKVRVAVSKAKNGSHLLYRGGVVRNVAAGSMVKIAKGFVELIGSVDGESVKEDGSITAAYRRSDDNISRELEVSLIGYLEAGRFHRGVREMPLLDNECFILSELEFAAVHTLVGPQDASLPLGVLAMEPTQAVSLGVDAIFASHLGIFGNTGSGKSYTLAKLYFELFKHFGDSPGFDARSRFVVIDFNGEYINRANGGAGDSSTVVIAEPKYKREYALTTRVDDGPKLPIPRAAIEDPSFWIVLLDATEKTQAPFLTRVLTSDYWDRRLAQPHDLLSVIGDMVLRATKSSDASVDRQTGSSQSGV